MKFGHTLTLKRMTNYAIGALAFFALLQCRSGKGNNDDELQDDKAYVSGGGEIYECCMNATVNAQIADSYPNMFLKPVCQPNISTFVNYVNDSVEFNVSYGLSARVVRRLTEAQNNTLRRMLDSFPSNSAYRHTNIGNMDFIVYGLCNGVEESALDSAEYLSHIAEKLYEFSPVRFPELNSSTISLRLNTDESQIVRDWDCIKLERKYGNL